MFVDGWKYAMNREESKRRVILRIPSLICASRSWSPKKRLGLKLRASQKTHPPEPTVPSILGHEKCASTLILRTTPPNSRLKYGPCA